MKEIIQKKIVYSQLEYNFMPLNLPEIERDSMMVLDKSTNQNGLQKNHNIINYILYNIIF